MKDMETESVQKGGVNDPPQGPRPANDPPGQTPMTPPRGMSAEETKQGIYHRCPFDKWDNEILHDWMWCAEPKELVKRVAIELAAARADERVKAWDKAVKAAADIADPSRWEGSSGMAADTLKVVQRVIRTLAHPVEPSEGEGPWRHPIRIASNQRQPKSEGEGT